MTYFLADDGEKIHIHISGEGSPLVLLHGWTASHLEWAMFMRHLNARYRVYRWDARAHGGHPLAKSTEPTVERMARDLHNMMEHYEIHQATIVGHSMGALILWQYLRDHGFARVAKLCFIDQSPKLVTDENWTMGIYGDFDQQRSQQFIASLHEDFAEGVIKLIAFGRNRRAREEYLAGAPYWEKTRAAFRSLPATAMIECWKSLTRADYRDVLSKINVPTLLIYGGESNFYTAETAQYVRQQIPYATLLVYEEDDHSPHMWQRERFVKDLDEFIAG